MKKLYIINEKNISDGFIFLLAAICISLVSYHPYYFGDELFSFSYGFVHNGSFTGTLSELNSYKPRIIMNLIWAFIVNQGLPRWVPMLLSAIAIATCAWLVYLIATKKLGASRLSALIGALLLLISRFNLMLYYDYVAGTVETLSLMFFLIGLFICADSIFGVTRLSGRRAIAVLFFFTACVLVHERYIAGIAGMLGINVLMRFGRIVRERYWCDLYLPIGIVVSLISVVVFLVKVLSDNSVTMGTAGKTVTVNFDTFIVAITYFQNLFLSSNYGLEWFVGTINQINPIGVRIFIIFAVIFIFAWMVPWLFKDNGAIAVDIDGKVKYTQIASILGFIFGMVLVASLPGSERQEARWMFPAFATVVLLVLGTYKGRAQYTLLLLFVASQVFYIGFGSLDRIFTISASKAARQLGYAMDAVDFPGDAGVMIAVPEPDTSWVLGGGDGSIFCHTNLSKKNCLFPSTAIKENPQLKYGFGLSPKGLNRKGDLSYIFIPRQDVEYIVGNKPLPTNGKILGELFNWSGWTISKPEHITADGLVLAGLDENFMRVKVDALESKFLIYQAVEKEGDDVPMRLQINWHDSSDKYIGSFIDVVEVTNKIQDYSAYITAPDNAAYGYVYASLHEDGKGEVLLKNVRVVNSVMAQ